MADAVAPRRTGFMIRIRSWFTPRAKAHAGTPASPLGGLVSSSSQSARAGTRELTLGYRQMPWLRAAVGRISTAVAATTWRVFRAPGVGMMGRAPLQGKSFTVPEGSKEQVNHPLAVLLADFNPHMTGRAAMQLVDIYLELKGEAFLLIERDGSGTPTELWPIHPLWVRNVPTSLDPFFEVSHNHGVTQRIPEDDMLWIRDHDPADPYGRGAGIGETLGDELDADESAAKHVAAHLANRAVPDLMIGVEGADESQLKRAKSRFENAHRGPHRAGNTHWHSGGLTVDPVTQSFGDMELVDLRQFNRDTVGQVFGIPPEILGIIENSNRATIDGAEAIFARWVLTPRLELLRTELQFRLVPQFNDPSLILAYDDPTPPDRQHSLAVATEMPSMLSVDEWRDLGDYPALDGDGSVHPVRVGDAFVDEPASLEPPDADDSAASGDNETRALRAEVRELTVLIRSRFENTEPE